MKKQQEWTCDICAKEGIAATFKAPTALGMHKRLKHGILGASPSAAKYREAKGNPSVKKAMKPLTKKEKVTSGKRSYVKRTQAGITVQETQALIAVGYLQAYCENLAKRFELPEAPFARRCAELFYASQVRA